MSMFGWNDRHPVPKVENRYYFDKERTIYLRIMAFRPLTPKEIMLCVAQFHKARDKRKKLKPGDSFVMKTLFGLRDGI